ncbi:10539_t:CDS:2 [Racocetra persica]|uniref:10539_t:CDS:1 n=1 Tax=Racocetra persica TaxID=160502 RepID=A0ACA9KA15_9GLOM|nr:10539_t:CDS:2 [Racocetra persica]
MSEQTSHSDMPLDDSEIYEDDILASTESGSRSKRARKGGPSFHEVWSYVTKGVQVNPGHYEATLPEEIQKYWCNKLAEENNTYRRNSQLNPNLPSQVNNYYDELLLKAWIMANIAFEVVENSFIKSLFKAHNPAYTLPSYTTLSERLLDKEFARVQNAINDELENIENLTLIKLSESELRDMVNLISINNFIDNEEINKSINTIYNSQNVLTHTNLILEDIVNLRDLIFQDRDIVSYEISNNNPSNNNKNIIVGNMNFSPENLVDTILNDKLEN